MAKVTDIKRSISGQVAAIRKALGDKNLSKVATAVGLHVNTVRSLARNEDQSFSLHTIEKLEKYLFGKKE